LFLVSVGGGLVNRARWRGNAVGARLSPQGAELTKLLRRSD
jgi:hypothetical protein